MADGNGNSDGLRKLADNVVMVLAARLIQLVAVPVTLAILYGLYSMLSSGHDSLTRIEQRINDQDQTYDRELADHESRIRVIEAAHRAGMP